MKVDKPDGSIFYLLQIPLKLLKEKDVMAAGKKAVEMREASQTRKAGYDLAA